MPPDLGVAKRLVVDKDNTTIIDGNGKKADIQARIAQLLEFAALTHKADAKPGQLSGGMKQRVVGAIAVAGEPRVVIADEPYMLSADGVLMPAKKDQAPPDLKYFPQARK